ncbi:hypothetical protein WJX73_000516 [Symbiochloris irregularis]|uniref:Uncharacterized protein n=1 Tax=Symbiochloris irregularis TaxID=706552 RepID=A0AAW1PZH9_9CHLO
MTTQQSAESDDLRQGLLATDHAEDAVEPSENAPDNTGVSNSERWCPMENMSLLSHASFAFCDSLISKGYKAPLQVPDLWDVPRKFETAPVYRELETELKATEHEVSRPRGSLLRAIVRTHWRRIASAGLVLTVEGVISLMVPLLLKKLLEIVRVGGHPGTVIALTLAMTVIQLAATVLNALFWFWSLQVSSRLRTGLRMLLFRKSLRLSVAARADNGVGAIVNLAANDVDRICETTHGANMVWDAPFQILLVLGLLTWILGWQPVLAGLVALLCVVPLSTLVTWGFSHARVKVLECTDARVRLISEVMQGIKALKLYAWEAPFIKRVEDLRARELFYVQSSAYLEGLTSVLFWVVPLGVKAAVFSVYALRGNALLPDVVFPALALLDQLALPLFFLPDEIGVMVQGRVSVRRLQAFWDQPEVAPRTKLPPAPPGQPAVEVKEGTFAWAPDAEPTLMNLNFSLESGKMLVITGVVGAGKTSLLNALMGEMSGARPPTIAGSIAYTAQEPWIQNASVRDNILMGAAFDQKRYDAILEACALTHDLAILPAGEQTEIGEKGLNLSGGQKHRIALARACYQDADVYLLDDPLSAVDVHVGHHLMTQVLQGLLASKTRVLVTHQLQFLPNADTVMVMRDGHIDELGGYQELIDRGVEFKQMLLPEQDPDYDPEEAEFDGLSNPRHSFASSFSRAASTAFTEHHQPFEPHSLESNPSAHFPADMGNSSSHPPHATALPLPGLHPKGDRSPTARGRRSISHTRSPSHAQRGVSGERHPSFDMRRRGSVESARSHAEQAGGSHRSLDVGKQHQGKQAGGDESEEDDAVAELNARLIEEEERALGRVDRALYWQYFKSWGPIMLLPALVFLAQLCSQIFTVAQNWWLSQWANKASRSGADVDTKHYLTIYLYMGLGCIVGEVLFAFIMALGSVRAAKRLHQNLLRGLLRLPMSFFDSQPTGRLMNRFTKDTQAVDLTLATVISDVINCMSSTLASLTLSSIVSPLAVLAFVPVAWGFEQIRRRYIAASRELKRLDSLALSPVLSYFTETLQGLVTVRAFGTQEAHVTQQAAWLQGNTRAFLPMISVNRWLGVRVEGTGALLVGLVAITCTLILPRSAGLAGLAITSTLDLAMMANWVLRQLSETEVAMNSVERMVGYVKENAPEAPEVIKGHRPPPGWPSKGDIRVTDLVVRYRADLPTVLQGVSFHVQPQHKVGVAGRTGCGKSTLILSLFRIIEAAGGSITIDGVDISRIGLLDLRSCIALVPQDPVIFSGSVRSNLDPSGTVRDDAQIWEALERTGIRSTIAGMEGGLDAEMGEGGTSLSTGQRQLLCMSRALLKAVRVLVLDEATSNVDTASDALIQDTVRTSFKHCTVLTVAHRLHTIMDSDRVLVMDAGRVLEYASPQRLLHDPNSAFSGLVGGTEAPQEASATE